MYREMVNPPTDDQDQNPFRAPQVANEPEDTRPRIPFAWRLVSYAAVTIVGAVSFYVCGGATCMAGASIMYSESVVAPLGLLLMLAGIPVSLVIAFKLSNRLWKFMTGQPRG